MKKSETLKLGFSAYYLCTDREGEESVLIQIIYFGEKMGIFN